MNSLNVGRIQFFFLEKYCKVITDKPVPQPFILYDFQKTKCIQSWLKYDRQIIVKGRQTGVSTVVAGYALWRMIFEEYFLTLAVAYDQIAAANIIAKIQLMIDNIPNFILPKQTIKNKLSVGFANGSEALALAHGSRKGRSFSPKLLIFDEAGFIDGLEKLYIASSPGLSKTKGQLIAISTPNGYGNWYANTYFSAPENGFYSEKIMWYEMAERDKAWEAKERQRLGDRAFSQEYECLAGDTFITVKEKETSEIKQISLSEFYEQL